LEGIMEVRLQQNVHTLAQATTFGPLSAETLGRLAAGSTESRFKRGGVVFERGAAASGVHVVATGQLKLCLETSLGAEHVVGFMLEGDSFGEAALLSNRAHPVTVIAVTDCKLLHVARQTLIAELERDRELARRIIATLGEQLYRHTSNLENVLFLKASGRVARFIVEHLKPNSAKSDTRVTLPVRKGLIASHLHMTQEHFSRTLRELTQAGLIRVDGTRIDVIEVEKLRDTAGMLPTPRYMAAAD
jgi:CRP-like cAMP-binding protein